MNLLGMNVVLVDVKEHNAFKAVTRFIYKVVSVQQFENQRTAANFFSQHCLSPATMNISTTMYILEPANQDRIHPGYGHTIYCDETFIQNLEKVIL